MGSETNDTDASYTEEISPTRYDQFEEFGEAIYQSFSLMTKDERLEAGELRQFRNQCY